MRQLMRLLRYLVPHLLQLVAGSLLLGAVGLLFAFRLLLLRPILDRVLSSSAAPGNMQLLSIPGTHYVVYLQSFVPARIHSVWTVVAYALVLSSLLKGICDYVGTYLVNHAGYGMITNLRNELYESILRRSAGFFQKHSTGTLISTIVNDIERVQYAMSSVLAEFLEQFFTFVFTAYAVVALGGHLAWVLVLFVPFILYSARRIGIRVRHTTRRGQDQLADVQNILQETITGNRIVKAFSMEGWEIARFRRATRRLFKANMRSVAAAAVSSPLMDLFGAIAVALLLAFGREQVKTGSMSLGVFGTFIGLVFSLYNPVRKFAMFYNNFQQALGASSELFRFMDTADEVQEKPGALVLPPFSRKISFEEVSFCYESEGVQREVLHGINLDVKAGEILAVVGSSGAGKSTLVSLVPRFFDVTTGTIAIDGHDVRDVTLSSLRSQIGIVTQETVLFNDTLRNNIAYGQPGVSQREVEAAARAALAHDFIMEMPEGYEAMIGEKGVRLSGGERQRIAIARALLKNAPILILDEATSALDSESEALVQSALQNLMAGRTVIVIAHRLSTVRRADRIVVLENGAIADIGTHEELLQKLGTYRRLYDLQFIDSENPRVGAGTQ
ncbi:MAG TPA: ABC transporter ATP-binding protein [Terriglobales bacterium]|nr:ABC transporter ATP-binding protein [Terriglobales bacterium]